MAKPINPEYGPRDSPEYTKNYFKKNWDAEKNRIYQRQYFKDNPDKYIYWSVRMRAKKKGIPFNLDFDDIKIPSHCPILGYPLQRNTGGKRPLPNSPSVDRIVPELGYVKGNIQIISQQANTMKTNATTEELLKFADWIRRTYGS